MEDLGYLSEYPPEPSSLIPLLQRTQERFGYLPREALEEIANYLGIPLSRVYGVATFYAQFRFEPLGEIRHQNLPWNGLPCERGNHDCTGHNGRARHRRRPDDRGRADNT
ncbi:NAD(P)H-dependent oxidoreductase subunit E [Thermococcus sp.]|uniref:NADH-quinone oxidoreductase subunit NuoE family protein n=1 Tax=Thermococcus sp. TaxID=35749 RepID=UPI002624245A|nr:NAD(P)H-dependent oxidoreductase subunit E [Thermococcus sp.]